jgi:glucokinase
VPGAAGSRVGASPAARSLEVVADVGGTHARFAIRGRRSGPASSREPVVLRSAEHAGLAPALRGFCASAGVDPGAVRAVAVAVAGPVTGDEVRLTNVGWSFSIAATAAELGVDRLTVLNDLEAVALALPEIGSDDREPVRTPSAPAPTGAPRAVVGVGTGLGTALYVPAAPGRSELAIAAEGGHRDLAATSEREWRIVERVAARHGRASAERILSGPGLVDLHRALAELDGAEPEELDPPEVAGRARAGERRAREAFELFSAWLGAFCGDLALTTGARSGIDLAGDLLGALGELFDRDRFRARFLEKGRFRSWLEAIPVARIVHPNPALVGCERASSAPRGGE